MGRYRLRSAVNWLTLATPGGLALARLAHCHIARGPRGLWFATGYRPAFPRAAAFTVGSVIFLRTAAVRPGPLLEHEERHTSQWAWCLGLLGFPALYAAATLLSWAVAGDRYSGNPFEVRAGLTSGGYPPRGPRRAARS